MLIVESKEENIKIPDEERTPCEVWTRVMGYHRPTLSWNKGKLQEHKDRRAFKEHNEDSLSI